MNYVRQLAERGQVPKQIAIFRAIKLGDLLCAVPAFRALRHAFPEAHISLISLPWARELVSRFAEYLDEFIPFPGWPGLPEQPVDIAQIPVFIQEMQARHWDLLIQLQGNGTLVNPLVALCGAHTTAGFYPTHLPQYCFNAQTFMPYPEKEHEIRRLVHLMEYLGIAAQGYALEFPVFSQDVVFARSLGLTDYVCIHAGGISGRRWPEQHFAEVADALAEQGYTIVSTGTLAEQSIIEKVQALMRFPSVSIAGQTDLGGLAAVLQQSVVLLSNDTGVAHLAAACQVPSVVIFTSADPAEWAPLNTQLHRVVLENEASVHRILFEIASLQKNDCP